jgi:hypothetical protein
MVNHFYFFCVDRDFGPFFLKFAAITALRSHERVGHSAARFSHDRGPFRQPRLRLRPDGRTLVPLDASSV